MPYLGNRPADSYLSLNKQTFTTSATANYALNNPVANANEIDLFINNVKQEPTEAYTASGTSLVLSNAITSSDAMYCIYLGKSIGTINPSDGSVGASQIVNSSITLNKLSATGTASASTFLRGDNTWGSAGGNNTPYFLATSNTGTIGSATWTKIPFANEVVDTSNCFDTTNYRFTPNVAGYYFVYFKMLFYASPGSDNMKSGLVQIYKNGAATVHNGNNGYYRNGAGLYYFMQPQVSYYVYLNGTTDYIEAWGFMESSGGLNYDGGGCYFMAHKLIA